MGLVIMIMIHDELRFSFNKRIFYSSWKRKTPGQVLGHPLPSPAALLRGPAGKEFIPLLVIKYNFKISNYTNLKSRDVAGGTTLMS